MANNLTLYLISGLGADRRVFKKLKLPDKIKVHYIDWIEPAGNEPLADYCNRLSKIIDTSEDFGIVGLSFGGIVAIELAKKLNPKQVIIISSISSRKELPLLFKIIGFIGLNRIVPSFLFKKLKTIVFWYAGVKTEEEKRLLMHFLFSSSPEFIKWAIDKVLHWKNLIKPQNLCHIHGTNDRIFPIRLTKADVKVVGGGHFMVHNQADMLSQIINERLGYSYNSASTQH